MVDIKAANQANPIEHQYGNKHRAENRTEAKGSDDAPTTQQLKDLQNARILESNAATILAGADDSQRLLYRAAIEKINEILEPELGSNAIQAATEDGVDFSPEATAERIVAFATSFYGRYREQNPDESEAEAVDNFLGIIQGGIEQGFNEAKEILSSMQVLEGEIAENIDTTFDLIQQKLDAFRITITGEVGEGSEDESSVESKDQ